LPEIAGQDGAAVAVTDDTGSLSWDDLELHTQAVACALEAAGVAPLGHVSLIASNRVEFITSLLGAQRGGFTVTPLKTSWTAEEIGAVLDDAASAVVITDTDAGRAASRERGLLLVDLDAGFAAWRDAHAGQRVEPGRIGYRVPYTSGTTGRPKGVRRRADAATPFEAWAQASAYGASAVGLPRHGTHLMVSPLFHGAPLAFGLGALLAGAPMRILGRWDPARALALLGGDTTASIMVPTMFRQLLALPVEHRAAFDPSGLVTIFHGGEACPPDVKQRMIDWWGPVLVEYYGFTEGGMTFASSAEWQQRPGTVGRPFGPQRVSIVGPEGAVLPAGEVGTIYIARPEGRDAFEYTNDPAKTAAAFRPDGAFTVGDLGYLDDDGYLFVTGRSAELIVTGGVNVYPAEIEAVVLAVDGVADACAAGMPDEARGEVAAVAVVVAPGYDAAAVVAAVQNACATRLAGYKRPRVVEVKAAVPRDATGKLQRNRYRQELGATAGLKQPSDAAGGR
jgi:long-chain acyl-CoA synthetase